MSYTSYTEIDVDACFEYTSPSGNNTWYTSGTYEDVVSGADGCDSVLTINLTIDTVNNGISKSGNKLIADAIGASYQWIKCKNGNIIEGEIGKEYTPTESGKYAVVVTKDGCTDTSACKEVDLTGIGDLMPNGSLSVYPNPSSGMFTIEISSSTKQAELAIVDMSGAVLSRKVINSNLTSFDEVLSPGSYLIELSTENGTICRPLIVNP